MIATVRGSMRDRLIEAANELFYAHGLRAVSADKVIERVGTTKVTFYRHFPTKDDLVVAYLEHRAAQEREGVDAAIAYGGGDVDVTLGLMADHTGTMACTPGFRGCPFINAAAEYADPDSAVRRVVDTHRAWWASAFVRLVEPLGLADPDAVAEDLVLLRDGVMVAGYLGDPSRVAASFLRSCRAVVGSAERAAA
ncbi:TetR/AcrR family transcriptional regulator [Promicromonospora thailandica]|uniref:Transcriptional regulator, TetR family n=1 Tax=Promicromonospora thailandica TaxID=765201 RepID=A0A9X2JUC7_9MICO|nr:TetR/AcrR family transcriptional regulator [Promicromonospora thailandica]MCP2263312.1 transcriptional regulator, TetR family [Promicromonospora thailandica]BFF19539.1 TetR/AcrR family transcriptional regulator [Promicromonospora thailandica]